ncbi:MAG: hypothetical protein A3F73_01225 [Gallionellales bacterium RIFCSPLOWO2_12_FULL_59_22]|nr:MAG: hypothetical protein A3H99_10155 [Gallionellales bacterium RIFCSPLOWO2_02_FULL_59_110]OGT04726.1 MAG: hypothetical protein A2Z65_10400 [Gallionellales bacterium RIFCSPLOWO2_02_58_13]OGT12934.1 MAG: hypothetical protein A3F73_01225 [Gallionellales bacterium RIFCSPLOWO2_12_FULL_59_22]
MSNGRDLIECLLQAVREMQPSFTEEQALQIEQQFRRDWGGERVNIAKRAENGTKPDREVAKGNGISRSMMYRWVSKNGGK